MHVFQQSNLVQQQQPGTSQVRYSCVNTIGHVNEYPTMHYLGIPIRSRSMIANNIWLSIFGIPSEALHCGNVVNMPYSAIAIV